MQTTHEHYGAMHALLAQMRARGGSDLFITAGFPPPSSSTAS